MKSLNSNICLRKISNYATFPLDMFTVKIDGRNKGLCFQGKGGGVYKQRIHIHTQSMCRI